MRKRKGEMIIVLMTFMLIAFSATAILTSANSGRVLAAKRARNVGDMDTSISVAEMCSDYFVRDFESKTASITIASGGYIGYTGDDAARREREYAIFETALNLFQNDPSGLKLENGDGTTWVYKITDPLTVVADSGITDDGALDYLTELLENATLKITVDDALSIVRNPGDDLTMTTGDTVQIAPIKYTVEFKKGASQITREYVISDRILVFNNADPYANITVSTS